MESHSAHPLVLARGLIAREAPDSSAPDTVGAAIQRLCTRMSTNLRDALGDDGCNALLSRALTRTESSHPALKDVRRVTGIGIELDGVIGAIERHGVAKVREAIEALLAALIDLLGRLIGEDMAINLIDAPPPDSAVRTS